MKIETYSERGLVVRGATAEQAQAIARELGANVCTQHNAKLGGWVFSRKREDRIRQLVAAMEDPPAPQVTRQVLGPPSPARDAVTAMLAREDANQPGEGRPSCNHWIGPKRGNCMEPATQHKPGAFGMTFCDKHAELWRATHGTELRPLPAADAMPGEWVADALRPSAPASPAQ